MIRALLISLTILLTVRTVAAQNELGLSAAPWNPPSDSSFWNAVSEGKLIFRGGLQLMHSDRLKSGGFSALAAADDGSSLIILSDFSTFSGNNATRSGWAQLTVKYDADGNLCNVDVAGNGQLHDTNGKVIQKAVESIARTANRKNILVSFDDSANVFEYSVSNLNDPAALRVDERQSVFEGVFGEAGSRNLGFEASTSVDGGLLMIAENIKFRQAGKAVPRTRRAFFVPNGRDSDPLPIRYDVTPHLEDLDLDPSGATKLADSRVLVLERKWLSVKKKVAMRIVEIPPEQFQLQYMKKYGKLCGRELFAVTSSSIDNFEGISSFQRDDGRDFVFLISDSNGDDRNKVDEHGLLKQKTLLVLFEIKK